MYGDELRGESVLPTLSAVVYTHVKVSTPHSGATTTKPLPMS